MRYLRVDSRWSRVRKGDFLCTRSGPRQALLGRTRPNLPRWFGSVAGGSPVRFGLAQVLGAGAREGDGAVVEQAGRAGEPQSRREPPAIFGKEATLVMTATFG